MNIVRRILGVVWLLLGPVAIWLIISNAVKAIEKASAAMRSNAILQWSIITVIFIPIAIGLMIFGTYSIKGAYDR